MNELNVTVFFNLGSLVLGCVSLMAACSAVFVRSAVRSGRFCAGSFGLCALSLLFQIAEMNHRVNIDDYSAIADTIYAVLTASAILLVLNIVINAIAFIRHRRG